MVLVFVLVLTLNQSYDSDRQSVHRSGLPSGESLLQEVRGGVSWRPPALRPSASTTVSKPRPQASGAAPSQPQNVAAMQEPGHPCPTWDSSNGQFLLWVSTPAWPKRSQSCSLGLFLYNPSFPHRSPRPFLLPRFLFPLSLQAIPCINLTFLTLLLLPRKLEITPLAPGVVPEAGRKVGLETGPLATGRWGGPQPKRSGGHSQSLAQMVVQLLKTITTGEQGVPWWRGMPLPGRRFRHLKVMGGFRVSKGSGVGGLPAEWRWGRNR